MKGLTSFERIILECVGKEHLTYEEIKNQTGIQENVCFNVLQSLIIRGLLVTDGMRYKMGKYFSPLVLEEINGTKAKQAESLEMIEAMIDQEQDRIFRFQKMAIDPSEEKIFKAMLLNLESFLKEAHQKAHKTTPIKDRKIVFWGMGEVHSVMNQLIKANS